MHFQALMTLAMFRGRYGAGVAVVPQNRRKEISILKTTETADELVHGENFDKVTKATPCALVGHARYPTTGGYALEDAHPHVAEHIIGVHNGTMDNVNGYYIGKNDNDSSILFREIAEHGVERVIQNSIGEFAIVWINKKDSTLNFLRNSKRPIIMGSKVDNFSTLYWASEPRMLWFVLGGGHDKYQFQPLPENRHYRFALGGTTLLTDDPLERKVTSVPPSKPNLPAVIPPIVHQLHSSGSSGGGGKPLHIRDVVQAVREKNHARTKTVLEEAFDKAGLAPKPLAYEVKTEEKTQPQLMVQYGPHMNFVCSFDEMWDKLSKGCGVCGNPGDYNADFKGGRTHFLSKEQWVCHSCVNTQPTAVAILRQSTPTRH